MIRIKLGSMLERASFEAGRRITMEDVIEGTGLSRTTLKRMANLVGYNAELSAIDALCRYFECQPGDLLEYVSQPSKAAKRPRRY